MTEGTRITAIASKTCASSPAQASTHPTGSAGPAAWLFRALRSRARRNRVARYGGGTQAARACGMCSPAKTRCRGLHEAAARAARSRQERHEGARAASVRCSRTAKCASSARRSRSSSPTALPRPRTRPNSSKSSIAICRASSIRKQRSRPGAPQLHDDVPGNLSFEAETGDAKEVGGRVCEGRAHHQAQSRIDARSAEPDGAARVSRRVRCGERQLSIQRRHAGRDDAAQAAFGVHESAGREAACSKRATSAAASASARVAYPEYCALMIAAKALGKPVKWVSTRVEGFLTDTHGRGNIIDGELALDSDGKFLGDAARLDQRHGRVPRRRARWATSATRRSA